MMDSQTYDKLLSFIWGIVNDSIDDVYDNSGYRKIILPMMVIRRFDAVLEPTKDKVIAERDRLIADKVKTLDSFLCNVSGKAFCNWSDYTLRKLKSITKSALLKKAFKDYLDGFSPNVNEVPARLI